MPQVPTTDEWKQWVDTDYICSIPVAERLTNIHTFPIFHYHRQEWMVFEPFGDKYMIVSAQDYEERRSEVLRNEVTSKVPVSGLHTRYG